MKTRRGSSIYRSELARMIGQFKPGAYVLCTYMVVGDSLVGIVERVNKAENKVYVAWSGGPVSQHDPDELMLCTRPEESPQPTSMEQVVKDNPSSEGGTGEGDKLAGRRMSRQKMATNPPKDESVADKEGDIHGLDVPRGGGFSIVRDLQKDLHGEASKGKQKTSTHFGRRPTGAYHRERGRVYKRTRRERMDEGATCPKCKETLELQPFTRSIKIWVCPGCNWKITADKLVD